MRLYWELARVSYRRHAAYRAASLAGLTTNAFFGLVRSYVFLALYRERPEAAGYDLADALTYVWLTQGLIMPVLLWGWSELAETIRSGEVATHLSRPWNYVGYWLALDAGRAAYHTLYRTVPTVLLGALLVGIRLPERPATWLVVALSFALAIVIGFCVRFLLNLAAFWVLDIGGINALSLVAINFLSGFVVPLSFFPPAARAVLQALPFAGMIDTPVRLWLEHGAAGDAAILLAGQAAWAGTLALGCLAAVGFATRRLVVQGG